jgi:transposase
MDYTTDDALAILYRCGITTVHNLMNHLKRGGFQSSQSNVEKKLAKLRNGDVLEDQRKHNGATPYLNEPKLKQLKKAHDDSPYLTARALGQKAKLKCDPRTINRGLHKLGLVYKRIYTFPDIKPDQEEKRVTFGEAHEKDRMWRRTFFLDESTFQAYSGRKYSYQYPGERVGRPKPKYPPKIHAIGMISYRGPTKLLLFEGNLTAQRFIDFLKILIEDVKDKYGSYRYRLYWDNDPKHTANIVKEFIKSNKLNVPNDWPPSSPDLNPIENVWGLMGTEIQKFVPKTVSDLKKRLHSIWRQKITKEYCEVLADSMKKRIRDVQESGGTKIEF